MTTLLSFLSLVAVASTTPGESAVSANCIIDRLGASDAAALSLEGDNLMGTGAFSAGAGSHLSPATSCAALHHWTAEQAQLAVAYTIAKLAQPSFEAALQRKGMDAAKLAAIYGKLPAEKRTRPLGRADIEAVWIEARAAHLVQTDDEMVILGRYIGLLNMIDTVPAMLACGSAPTPPTPNNLFPEAACR